MVQESIEQYVLKQDYESLKRNDKRIYVRYIRTLKWIYKENAGSLLFIEYNRDVTSYVVRYICEMMTYFDTNDAQEALKMANRLWLEDCQEEICRAIKYKVHPAQLGLIHESWYSELRLSAPDFEKCDELVKDFIRDDVDIADLFDDILSLHVVEFDADIKDDTDVDISYIL